MKRDRRNLATRHKSIDQRREAILEYGDSRAVGGEETFRMIFQNSPLGIFRSTFEGQLLEVNPALVKMFGYDSAEDMVGQIHDVASQMYVRPEDRRAIVSQQFHSNDVTHHLNHYRRKDGSEFSANLHLKTVRDSAARPIFLLGIVEDPTERERMEERLRSLHKHALGLSSAKDLDAIVNYTLDTMQRVLDFGAVEFDVIEDGFVKVRRSRGNIGLFYLIPRKVEGPGAVAKAARELKSVRVNDAAMEPSYVDRMGPNWKGPPTMLSELATPVIIDGRAVGVLNVEHTRRNAFSEQDQILLENLASHVASEIKRLEHERRLNNYSKELRRSSQFLEAIIENANVWLNVLDERKNVVMWNKAAETISGYSRKEVLGHGKIWDWLYPDQAYRSEVTESVNDVLKKGRADEDVETHIRRKDGEIRIISWNERSILGENGKAIGSIAIGRDVTERRRMEEELKQYSTRLEELVKEKSGKLVESERRFRELASLLPQIVFELDVKGNYTFVNRSGIAASGYTEEEVYSGLNAVETFVEGDREKIKKSIDRILAGKSVHPYEFTALRKDGSTFPVLIHSTAIIHDGKHIGVRGVAMDITERKTAENELRQSERRFRELAELLPQIVFETDESGVFTYVNRVGLLSTGYTEDDLRNRAHNIFQLVPPEEYRKVSESLARQNKREPIQIELKVLRKDGSVFPALVYADAIVRDRKIVGFRGVVVEITEQKRIQEELQTARRRLEHLVATNPAAIYSGKPLPDYSDWYLTYISDRVTSLLGFEPQQYLDLEFWRSRLHPDDRSPTRIAMARILKEGHGSVDYRFLHRNGTYRWLREEATADRNDSGVPVEVRGYLTDITDLKMSEKAQRESEARYARLFENSPISLWEEDFSQVKRYFENLRSRGINDLRNHLLKNPEDVARCGSMVKILNVNAATLKLYGAESVSELIGELRRVLTREEYQDNFIEELVALWNGKTSFSSEFDNQTVTGETKHVDLILTVIPGYEETLGKVLVSIIDLTERKQIERRLQQAQRLAAMGETAAMVGHDLRNPLQGIAGALHLLKEGSLSSAERTEILGMIEKSLDYADSIVRDLAAYSAEIQLNLTNLTPKGIISEARRAVRIPTNVSFEDLTEDSPTFRADLARLRRVFVNLMENALDAMAQGGKLTIQSKCFEGAVQIIVSDSGIGMPEKVAANLWKPFQTTKAKGLGLGLSISKRIVDAHRGTISVKSEPGAGTTITVTLPTRVGDEEVRQ